MFIVKYYIKTSSLLIMDKWFLVVKVASNKNSNVEWCQYIEVFFIP